MERTPESVETTGLDPIDSRAEQARLRTQSELAQNMANQQDPNTARALAYLQQTNPQEYLSLQQGLINESRTAVIKADLYTSVIKAEDNLRNIERQVSLGNLEVDEKALNGYKQQINESKNSITALSDAKLAPFVKTTGQNITVDIAMAIKNGVPESTLKAAGISIIAIEKAKNNTEAIARWKKVNTITKSMIAAGNVETARTGAYKEFMIQTGQTERPLTPEQFKKYYVDIGADTWVPRSAYNNFSATEKYILESKGSTGLQAYWNEQRTNKYLLPHDVLDIYKTSTPEDKFAILQSYNAVPNAAVYTGSKNGEPLYKMGTGAEAFVMSPKFTNMVVDMVVPIVGTVRDWNKSSAGEKALYIAGDLLFFIPILKAGTSAARASGAVTREARMLATLKGFRTELVAQSTGAFNLLLHPADTAKAAGRNAWDTLESLTDVKGSKLLDPVISTTHGTIRIPIGKNISTAEAVYVRNKIMQSLIDNPGSKVVLEVNGHRYTYDLPAVMKTTKGGLVHTTPHGEAFVEGLTVSTKPNMSLAEQGLFLSPEPLPRFTGSSAFGSAGDNPTIFITSADDAADAIGTGKVYKSSKGLVTELELKYPVGYTVNKPKQILYTRIGRDRTKVAVMLQDPLSYAQRVKLKGLAVIEEMKAPFKPSLLIENIEKGNSPLQFSDSIDIDDAERLARILRESGNVSEAANLRAAINGVRAASNTARDTKGSRIANGTLRADTKGKKTRIPFEVTAERIGKQRVKTGKTSYRPIALTNNQAGYRVPAGNSGRIIIIPPNTRITDVERVSGKPTKTRTSKTVDTTTTRIPPDRRELTAKPNTPGRPDVPITDEPSKPPIRTINNNKRAEERINRSDLAIGWRQGELHGLNRYDVIVDPFTAKEEYLIVMGSKPKNVTMVKGPRSAYNTAQTISGKLKRPGVVNNPGIMSTKLWPTGSKKVNLQFIRDTGISQRRKNISITPKKRKIPK